MRSSFYGRVLCALSVAAVAGLAGAQQLPNAPGALIKAELSASEDASGSSSSVATDDGQTASTPQASAAQGEGVQTKRILGIIPNFRAVSADAKLPPLTVKQKFVEASQDNFDYSAIFLPLVVAGYSDATKATPEFGHGGIAYGRYLWHSVADQSVENYMVEFVGPVVFHEDPRYYTKGRGGFLKRAGYSVSRIVITRTDKDTESFNYSEVLGAGAASGISDLYYPSPERTVGKTMDKFGTNLGIDALTFVFKEFWPDINKAVFHGKQ
jgi:hypothetical protein